MSTSLSPSPGPYARESRADAWLFEHSKFLRKHFSPKGPIDLPSKHELVQERSFDGNVFPRERKMDAALFEHSKFLRKHVKHEGDDQGIKSKHAMLRESFDGERSTGTGMIGGENVYPRPHALRETMRGESNTGNPLGDPTAQPETYDPTQDNGAPVLAPADTTVPHLPAGQAATDTSIPYGDKSSSHRSAAGVDSNDAVPGSGLIEHHPTTMESTPVVGRPVPHSLMSNSAHARFGDGVDEFDGMREEDPMARVRRAQDDLRRWSSGKSHTSGDGDASTARRKSKNGNPGRGSAPSGRRSRESGYGSRSGSGAGAGVLQSGGGEYDFLQPYR